MFRWIGIAVSMVFMTLRLWAIDASVAHSVFFRAKQNNQEQSKPVLSLYWQINPKSLHFVTRQPDKVIVARIKADIRVLKGEQMVAEDHFILQTNPRRTLDELASLSVLEIRNYDIEGGVLKLNVQLTDMNDTTSKFAYNSTINVPGDTPGLFYSDIQLLDTFFRSDLKTPFARDGQQMIPLCADFLDDNKRNFHYYCELYNLDKVLPAQYPLVQRARIGKKENEAFFPQYSFNDTMLNAVVPDFPKSFPIRTLVSGNYYFTLSLEDKFGTVLATRSRFFQRLNLNPEKEAVVKKEIKEIFKDTGMENVTVLNLEKTFLAKYTLPQIRAMLKMLLPMSDAMQTNTINNFLKKPDEMYMRYYIYNYFLDIDKENPERAWKQYSEQVREVNKKYTEQGRAGYETDRGFIYLRYGKPSEVVTVSGETGSLPYEIWQYNTITQFSNKKELANALFLFYKPAQMMSEYRLLHSTVSGEAVNLSWRMYLYTTNNAASNAGINTNSRAEQYIGTR
jgi:GWxTD domain-containing protein